MCLGIGEGAFITQKTTEPSENWLHSGLHITSPLTIDETKESARRICESVKDLFSTSLANTPLAGAKLDVACDNFLHANPGLHGRGKTDGPYEADYSIDQAMLQSQLDKGNIVAVTPTVCSTDDNLFLLPSEELAPVSYTHLTLPTKRIV